LCHEDGPRNGEITIAELNACFVKFGESGTAQYVDIAYCGGRTDIMVSWGMPPRHSVVVHAPRTCSVFPVPSVTLIFAQDHMCKDGFGYDRYGAPLGGNICTPADVAAYNGQHSMWPAFIVAIDGHSSCLDGVIQNGCNGFGNYAGITCV
jgi:hypothetical protein